MAPVSDASVGVDLHPSGDAAELSAAPGGRATLVAADATTWQDGTFEAVIAVGVAHVFGGPGRTLDAVRRHLAPGGRVLLGDGIWDTPPTAPALLALDATAEDFHDPEGLSSLVRKHGYEPVHGHVSTLEEWDEYEWSWTGSLTDWALEPGRDPGDREQALAAAVGLLALADLAGDGGAASNEEGPLRGVRRELEGAVVGRDRLLPATEPTEQVGAGGVERVVAVE